MLLGPEVILQKKQYLSEGHGRLPEKVHFQLRNREDLGTGTQENRRPWREYEQKQKSNKTRARNSLEACE